ncbi:TRAP transporter small permease [Arhodomonas aquaeolei]|uniref:TRAP transporter small permease n=1 Tax=Arhodomonas aquaeolei TaxID=2369 RepID=UPI0021682C8E|nr:TRAP transporter small permease [Arhodomonas aquaeolei]MCS4504336.1 TRAP transporter small permease [Arhodomonas aquaeolei]
MLSLLQAVERGLDAVIRPAAFLALAGMIVVTTLQIVFRVAFDAISWSEELARYLLVWTTFLGATLAYQRGRHIAVTVLVDRLPRPLGRFARVLAHAASVAFFVVVIVAGWRYMDLQSFQVSASLRIPMPWVYAVIPGSAAVMGLYAAVDLLEVLFGRDEAGDDAVGAED